MKITETERQQLLADARRMVLETNFQCGLVLRMASEAEKAALEAERSRIRELARRFHIAHGREHDGDAWDRHRARQRSPTVCQVIPFPKHHRRLQRV
jgi:hypothetical protein